MTGGAPRSATIAAVATPPASGGVGILRVSGPEALASTSPLAPTVPSPPLPRHAYLADFVDEEGAVLDQGLFLFFQAPHSFTGEDVVELQAHGSPRLLGLLLARVLQGGRARLAEPGEFTRRAFLNGRIDLARAEAVADLVAAESEAAVRAAAAQVRGALSERVRSLRAPLLELRADLEATLDFPEEAGGAEASGPRLRAALGAARALLSEGRRGGLVRRGARVVLYGPVNAGKSTLFNRLVGEERALVDEEPGTTRDALEARLELGGLEVALVDTAGLREDGAGRVEALGIARTREALASADLAVLVAPPGAGEAEAARWLAEGGGAALKVLGKGDLPEAARGEGLRVSGLTGEGVDALREAILGRLWEGGAPAAVALSSERHADALRRCVEALERAEEAAHLGAAEVVAGEVGLALEALGEITGESASDELLDAIFRRFCIGK